MLPAVSLNARSLDSANSCLQARRLGFLLCWSAGTEPATFHFENDQWFAEDRPLSSKPKLPAEETGGIYGSDPSDAPTAVPRNP